MRAAGCVFAEQEAALLSAAAGGSELEALVTRRVGGEPLEHLLGWVSFAGLRLSVGPGVFVPRQRTVHLARSAVGALPAGGVLVELCCGVAPVAALAAATVPTARVWAVDLDPVAVGHAARNLGSAGIALVGDLDAALPATLRGRVDVLACNAPYVPTAAVPGMPAEARDHEPLRALDGGADGLDVHRRLAGVLRRWLAPGGTVLVEVAAEQAGTVAGLFGDVGLASCVTHDQELGATAVIGRTPGP